MKKPILLLMTFLFVMGVNAQLRLGFDRNYEQWGYFNIALDEDSVDIAFSFDFNLVDVAVGGRASTSSNVRSVGGLGFNNEGLTITPVNNNVRYQNGKSTQVQAAYYNSISQVIETLQTGTSMGGSNINAADGYADVIIDVPNSDVEGDKAFAVWPGVGAEGVVMVMYYNLEGNSVKSDISFDLLTLDAGTVGKTVNVKGILQFANSPDYIHPTNGLQNSNTVGLFAQATSENASEVLGSNCYVAENIYTSSTNDTGKQKINVAEAFGLDYGVFSDSQYIVIYLFIDYDAPNSFDAYYPVVGLDNLYVEFGTAKWLEPEVKENEIYAFDPIEVYPGIPAEYKVILKDEGRLGTFSIVTDNEVVNIYSVKSVLANDGEGNYTQEIEGIEITNNEGNYEVTIPAPEGGSVNDDIELTLAVSIPRGAMVGGQRTYRMELNNGVRFWADFTANIVAAPVVWVEPAVEAGETDATGFELPLGNHKTPVTFKLIDNSRWADLVISTDNETEVAGFYFEEEGAIKSGDSSVDYDFVYDAATTSYTLTVPYGEGELVDDDLEVTMYASLDSNDTSLIGEKITYRLAVNNGILIYKELVATVVGDPTGIEGQTVSNIRLTTSSRTITVENAEEDVVIINATGQVVKNVPAAEAAKGITLGNGVYIVKSGAYVQKALVK